MTATDKNNQPLVTHDKVICQVPGSWCDGKHDTVGALHVQEPDASGHRIDGVGHGYTILDPAEIEVVYKCSQGDDMTAEQAMAEIWGTVCPDCGPDDYTNIVKAVQELVKLEASDEHVG